MAVVLVTGASGGLGGPVVRTFQAAGASMVLPDRADDRVAKLFPELAGSEDHLLISGVDATQPDDMARVVASAVDRFGRIDVLINTVGGYRAGTPVHETPLETWDLMMNLNARSIFVTSRAVLPVMVENGFGRVIHTAAMAALSGSANHAAYSASKAAVARVTESMAAEYRGQGITVNSVLPGTIDTESNRKAMPKADFSKWVAPEAIAQVMVFLASEAGAVINGALIPVTK